MNFFGGVSICLLFAFSWAGECPAVWLKLTSFIFLGGTCLKGTFDFFKFVFEIFYSLFYLAKEIEMHVETSQLTLQPIWFYNKRGDSFSTLALLSCF